MSLVRRSSNKENAHAHAFCRPAAAVRAKAAKAKAGIAAGLGIGLPSRRLKRSTSVQRAKVANGKPVPKLKASPRQKAEQGWIKLPRSLVRPDVPTVAELELDGEMVPAAFITDKLQPLLSGLLLAAALFQPYPGASKSSVEGRRSMAFGLPRAHAHLDVTGLEPDLCLALHKPGSNDPLQLFPVHRLVYAAQCAYFPSLPMTYPVRVRLDGLESIPEDASVCSSAASSETSHDLTSTDATNEVDRSGISPNVDAAANADAADDADDASDVSDAASISSVSEASDALHTPSYLHLPLLGLEVPFPETWELLHVRLHSSDSYCWQKQLLGLPGADSPATARRLLAAMKWDELMGVMRRVHGTWQNCCALGVGNDRIWEQLGSAWGCVVDVIAARATRS